MKTLVFVARAMDMGVFYVRWGNLTENCVFLQRQVDYW